jgi:long-chain fatty acid transport protein
MKRATLLLSALVLITLISTTTFAAGVDLTGVGARASAMGGNFRSIANDWSAMYWNPAGLSYTEGLGAGFSVEFVMPRAKYTVGNSHYYNMTGNNNYKQFSASYQNERSAEPQNFVVPSGGVTYNMGRLAFGLGVWAPFGLGSKWDLLQTQKNNLGSVPGVIDDEYNPAYPNFEYESNMQVIDIHPTVSFKISDKLSIGVGGSFVMADIAIRQPAFLANPYLYNSQLTAALSMMMTPDDLFMLDFMRRPPFDHLLNDVSMDATGNGFGANVGVMFKPTEKLSIGASLQYYTDLSLSGSYSATTYFADAPSIYNGTARAIADQLLAAGAIDQESYVILSNYYSGQAVTRTDIGDAEASMPLPMKFGLGVSYSGIKNLLVAADFTYTQWSAWGVIPITDAAGATVSELTQNWNDTFKVGLGFEYTAGIAKIRGGVSTENPAAVEETLSPGIPDMNRRTNLSVGLAFPLGPVVISANYEKIFIPENEITDWYYGSSGVAENMAGIYRMNVNNLFIGLDYSF